VGKSFIAWLFVALPVGAVILLNSLMPNFVINPFQQEGTSEYKDGVEFLLSCSQGLTTVSLSAIAAAGFLHYKYSNISGRVCRTILSILCFFASVLSIYFSTRLGYWASFTVVSKSGDIQALLELFSLQAFSQLVAASALAGLALRIGLE